ncbi:hypothetical protein DFP72DRAFT_862119 [Ephemerocybe angulata]|uniref:Uncharacterized protein n=1 Tax=Ephemerocybe angulata TaxID=980116 RepID=A0A8H6LUN7_9AGAR|nr:hypothetical protein DFP72DRAFT_862119 [Tulosesus angulatus]
MTSQGYSMSTEGLEILSAARAPNESEGHPWSDLVNIESFDAEQPRSRVPLVNVRRLGGLSERIGGRRDEGGLRRMIRQEWDDEYQPVNAVDPNHTPVKPDHVRSAHTQGFDPPLEPAQRTNCLPDVTGQAKVGSNELAIRDTGLWKMSGEIAGFGWTCAVCTRLRADADTKEEENPGAANLLLRAVVREKGTKRSDRVDVVVVGGVHSFDVGEGRKLYRSFVDGEDICICIHSGDLAQVAIPRAWFGIVTFTPS